MKTFTVTVSVSVTRAISAESEEELRDLILNGCTDIETLFFGVFKCF